MSTNRVLVVDDEAKIGSIISAVAEGLDYEADSITDPLAFKEAYRQFKPTILFIDLAMPGLDGVEMLDQMHRQGVEAAIFIISGHDQEVLKTARNFGLSKGLNICGALAKPIDIDLVEEALLSVRSFLATTLNDPRSNTEITHEEIRDGLANGAFLPRFQPKLSFSGQDCGKGWLCGAEALVRWRHPLHGELSPGHFLPMIEAEGLMPELTEIVLSASLKQMQRWAERGLSPLLAINLSPVLLTDLDLPDRYENLVRAAGVDPDGLIFEVTESAVMEDTATSAKILTRFRIKGFGLSIDDFGTGYSSLVELYRMPFSELKIDRMFVARALEEKEADVIVRQLIGLAHGLGISVCAEGAENIETLSYLAALGCDKVQGYAVDRPLLAEDFLGRLDRERPMERRAV